MKHEKARVQLLAVQSQMKVVCNWYKRQKQLPL